MNGRLLAARVLVAVGVVLATAGLLALFLRRTALNDNEARSLAHQLIARPDLRAEVASLSVDRLYRYVNVPAELRAQLPPAEKGLAGPLSAALRGVAQQGVERLLAEPGVQALWTDAVYRAHREAVAIIENRSRSAAVVHGRAVLDLRPIVLRAGDRVGIAGNLDRLLPANAGKITLFRNGDLGSAQQATRILNASADWFWVAALALFAAAIGLGRRTLAGVLRTIAAGLVLAGVALLAIRSIVGHYVVDSLVPVDWARPAVATTWSVLTARLADSAWTTIGVGAVGLAGIWLQGSPRAARLRQALAPALRSTQLAYGLLAAALVLLRWWGPTLQTREWQGLLLIALVAAIGVEVLRRTTAREFPGAKLGLAWPAPRDHDVDRLERLAHLHAAGSLTPDEFAAAKRKILA